MSKAAAKTGLGPTAFVAIEQFFPENQRGITDEYSYKILPAAMKAFVCLMRFKFLRNMMVNASDKTIPGMWAGMICRKRYTDDKLSDSISKINAVVNLGAGYDTRTFRVPGLEDIPCFEVDQPEIIYPKKILLSKVFDPFPSRIKLVSVDFDKVNLLTVLNASGYSTDMRSFFIMEGVTQYITAKGIKATFDFLSKAAPGSRMAFTYITRDFIEGRELFNWDKAYNRYVLKERMWLWGINPEEVPGFLKQYGWQLTEDAGYGDLHERYVKPTGRELVASQPVERIAYAEKV